MAPRQNQQDPASWAQLFGISWNPNDPEIPDYQSALAQNEPIPMHGFSVGNTDSSYQGDTPGWYALGYLMLQQRALLYLRRKPGDCVGFQGSSGGPSVGASFAGAGIAGATAAAQGFLNPVSDISSALAEIKAFFTLFTGADQEILSERNLFCPLSIQMTQLFQQFDSAVVSGKADVNQTLSQLAQVTQQAQQFISSKMSLQQAGGANTSGCYVKWIGAHLPFRQLWYPKAVSGSGSGSIALIGAGGLAAAKIAGLF